MDPNAAVTAWTDDPEFPASDWQYEVANGDTRSSYAEWVASQRATDVDSPAGDDEALYTFSRADAVAIAGRDLTDDEVFRIEHGIDHTDTIGDTFADIVHEVVGDDGDPGEQVAAAVREPPVSCLDGHHRPDDDPTPGDRCKDCGHVISWLGPSPYDWECDDCDNLADDEAAPVFALSAGDRVRFRRDIDRYPHTAIKAGETGTVIRADFDIVAIRPDDPREALAEWDGCVEWYPDADADGDTTLAALAADVERIT